MNSDLYEFDLDGHLNIVRMSRTVECLGLLPLVGRWTGDRLMVVYMNGVVSCGCVGGVRRRSHPARNGPTRPQELMPRLRSRSVLRPAGLP